MGGTLATLIKADERLPEATIKKFAYEVLEGLSYLHSQGIIYGDLRPQNIMMNEYQRLKLCDFGASCKVADMTGHQMQNSAEDRISAQIQSN